ncbi:MAG: chromosome segregation protein SMC [Moraxellaceae bacterium]|nr:chromosome segregation protein SMC [Moraxellaceae bacterium]
MRLARIKLAGFKSFVDPTTVLTPGQLVGIVGPNGCGKSNVIDAVRWVLGETRASALRGESMQDVIFNGSTTRKPASRASVELVFDNSEGKLGGQWGQYAELSVKRVLDRSGDSEYFINQMKVRRKDVIDLFLGTGLGPRAYAIIEQGMISRVIEAKPEDIRAFLEEAAGISKYKERRRETEGRLSDARDNLARLEDIRAELGQQIGRLSGQAEIAQRYQGLHAQLTERQTLLWQLKHKTAREEHAAASQGLTGSLAELDRLNNTLQRVEAEAEAAREAHTVASEAVGVAQGDFYGATAEVSRIESELKQLRDSRQKLAQRIAQLELDSGQWAQREDILAEEQARWEALQETADQRVEAARSQLEGSQSQLPELESAHAAARQTQDSLRQEHARTEQQLRVEETRRAAATRALEGLGQRRQRIEQESAEAGAQEMPDLDAAHARVDAAQEALLQLQAGLATAQSRQDSQLAAAREAQQAERQSQSREAELRARLTALQSLQSRLRDAGDLAEWLRGQGLHELAPMWQRVTVEQGWDVAVEAVLRERIASLEPRDGVPSRVLSQGTPAPLVLTRPADSDASTALSFESLTPLSSRTRSTDASAAAHLKRWLAGVFCVDDLAEWLPKQADLPLGIHLVSPTGHVLSRDELRLFAPDPRTHGAAERQREIDSLRGELATHEEELERLHAIWQAQEESLQAAQEAVQEGRRAQSAAQQSLHAAQLEQVQRQQQADRLQERLKRLQADADEVSRLEGAEQQQLSAAEATLDTLRERAEQQLAALDEAAELAQARDTALQTGRSNRERDARSLQEVQFSLRECEARLIEIARNLQLARDQRAQGQGSLDEQRQEHEALDEAVLVAALQEAITLRETRESALSGRRNALEDASGKLRSLDEERLRTERALAPLRDGTNDFRLRQQAAELAAQQALERLTEMEKTADDTNPLLLDAKEGSLTREVSRLNREIAELGPVNLAALTELTVSSERKQFLDEQYDDLMQAVTTLEDAIRRIDRETRELLQGTYNTVNRQFGELFPRLFGGGEAQLVLTGDEILDAGVHIVARPPGKKNTSIHLLSGGEKALTAIALVFAMFQLNPAPFCMLDEVDAPLDDTNTERYCEMVKHMSAVTQFVFISHSKITMEMGRQLVGVTMQEKGVSRIVEVDIDEAMRLALPA